MLVEIHPRPPRTSLPLCVTPYARSRLHGACFLESYQCGSHHMTKSHDHHKMAAGSAVFKEIRCLLSLLSLIYMISVVKTVSSISFNTVVEAGKQFKSCHRVLAVQFPVNFKSNFANNSVFPGNLARNQYLHAETLVKIIKRNSRYFLQTKPLN